MEDNLNEVPPFEKGEVAFVFNLKNRIAPQLKYCENFLKERQFVLVKDDGLRVEDLIGISGDWPDYLRILDAKTQKADDGEIAGVLFPDLNNTELSNWAGSRAVEGAFRQAKKLVAGGYRQIFANRSDPE